MAKTEQTAETAELIAPALGFDVEAVAALGAKAAGAEIITITAPAGMVGVPASIPAVLERGANPSVESVAALFEGFRQKPERRRGTARVETLDSFCALVNRHKTADSAVFAKTDWRKPSLLAVIDYHENKGGGAADWMRHQVSYHFPLSEEWQAWLGMDGQKMSQGDFAAFLEDHIAELSSPTDAEVVMCKRDFATTVATPAELVSLSRGLAVHVGSTVKNTVTLQSGEGQIVWDETHKDAQGNALKVPGMFLLSIAPFANGEKIRVPVRLRYRTTSGAVVWFFNLYRPDIHITEQVRSDLQTVRDATSLPVFEGEPEA